MEKLRAHGAYKDNLDDPTRTAERDQSNGGRSSAAATNLTPTTTNVVEMPDEFGVASSSITGISSSSPVLAIKETTDMTKTGDTIKRSSASMDQNENGNNNNHNYSSSSDLHRKKKHKSSRDHSRSRSSDRGHHRHHEKPQHKSSISHRRRSNSREKEREDHGYHGHHHRKHSHHRHHHHHHHHHKKQTSTSPAPVDGITNGMDKLSSSKDRERSKRDYL